MKIAVYTSAAVNYYAKAAALAASLAKYSPTASLTLLLSDEPLATMDPEADGFRRVWTPPTLGYDDGWIFQHNVMELCTAVKGRALCRLMEEEPDADLFVYLDPDVYVYNDLEVVAEYLGEASIGLVPHILRPEASDIGVRMTEMSVTEHGIYNLGHLFVRPDANGRQFANWWGARLDQYCFDDKEIGLFTDQRWVDLAPAIFDGVKILRVPNLDVATWNISSRTLKQTHPGDESSFVIDDYPLVTYHFSGTGPSGTHRRVREVFAPSDGCLAEIERAYEAEIESHGQSHLERVAPFYDLFEDGAKISATARKMYRLHTDLAEAFPNPFASGPATYQAWLRANKPEAASGLDLGQFRRANAFRELFDEEYYLHAHPDVRDDIAAGEFASAEEHYVMVGSRLLYDPNEFFVSRYYLEQAKYLDSFAYRSAKPTRESTLLWHYLSVGLANGVEPIEFFDSTWYLRQHGDVRVAFVDGRVSCPLSHFYLHGALEGRQGSAELDLQRFPVETPPSSEGPPPRGAFGAFVRLGNVSGRAHVATEEWA